MSVIRLKILKCKRSIFMGFKGVMRNLNTRSEVQTDANVVEVSQSSLRSP